MPTVVRELPVIFRRLRLYVAVFYLLSLGTNMMGCSFFYLQPAPHAHIPLPDAAGTITFLSCNNQQKQTGIFDRVRERDPDLVVWTGDIIYPDWPVPWPGNNLDKIAHKYALLQQSEGYQRLCAEVPVTGIYDDHDFGQNNGNATYHWKKESAALLRRFLGEDSSSERSHREAAFTVEWIHHGEITAGLILLDTRYFREQPSAEADMLGEEQWHWFDSLLSIRADVWLIVSGTSVLSDDHCFEGWQNYPASRQKLFDRLGLVNVPVIFISGDKHFGEINRQEYHGRLYTELVSSGVTHSERPPTRYRNDIESSRIFLGKNFGEVHLPDDLSGSITLQVLDEDGQVQLRQQIPLLPVLQASAGRTRKLRTGDTESPGHRLIESFEVHSYTRALYYSTSFKAGFPGQPDIISGQ